MWAKEKIVSQKAVDTVNRRALFVIRRGGQHSPPLQSWVQRKMERIVGTINLVSLLPLMYRSSHRKAIGGRTDIISVS